MEAKGLRCDLHLYEGQPHSFFNYDVPDDGSGPFYGYRDTLFKTDEFLVSLGYLSDPHDAPAPATGWVTIFGDAGFSGGSAATASPVTTDADADAIAANFAPVTLADGDFIRLTGSVTFNAPLTGDNFRIGLFDGDNPVTAGDGTGYVGIWARPRPPLRHQHRCGQRHRQQPSLRERGASTTLGPVPAAAATVPANTPVEFTLMIARNGGNLDIRARFTDGASYNPSQNLLNLAVADFTYDSVAFLMTGNLNATQGSFSNIGITGPVLPVLSFRHIAHRQLAGDVRASRDGWRARCGLSTVRSAPSDTNPWMASGRRQFGTDNAGVGHPRCRPVPERVTLRSRYRRFDQGCSLSFRGSNDARRVRCPIREQLRQLASVGNTGRVRAVVSGAHRQLWQSAMRRI